MSAGSGAFRVEVQESFRSLRERILAALESLDGGLFRRKAWTRSEGGGGEMAELRGGLFEKGGCNFSAVWGDRYPSAIDLARPSGPTVSDLAPAEDALGVRPPRPEEVAGQPFFATGVSLVLHPRNPFVPIVHLNVRYLEVGESFWFGGGTDLTPCKPFPEDTEHFHGVLREVCGRHGPEHYPRFSRWARDYFFIAHRNVERGQGGVFFDYLRGEREKSWAFTRDLADAFLPAYEPLVRRRRDLPYGDEERSDLLRFRGRYVEFNLIYDRGTLFGLRTGGNVEAIFMSLPPLVAW